MSYDLNVYLSRQDMPAPAAWREAIIQAGFPVELDSEFDVDTFTGFLPSPVRGEMSGFEYYSREVAIDEIQEMELKENFNFSVLFVIGSRPLELVSALSAASVLASISNGILVDPQSGESFSSGEVVTWTQAQIAQINEHFT